MYAEATFPSQFSVQPKDWSGTIQFFSPRPGAATKVIIDLQGLRPNSYHAIHVHEKSFKEKGGTCKDLGPHWNPTQQSHGSLLVDPVRRHVGDLCNNVLANSRGSVHTVFEDPTMDLWNPRLSPASHSIVIHEMADDLGLGGLFVDRSSGAVRPPLVGEEEHLSNGISFIPYPRMSSSSLDALCRSRGYGSLPSRKSAIDRLMSESSQTGNAGGRMACANVI